MALAITRLHHLHGPSRNVLLSAGAAFVGAAAGLVFARPVLAMMTELWHDHLRPAFDELARSGFLSWCL